jgi:hypothetical protein
MQPLNNMRSHAHKNESLGLISTLIMAAIIAVAVFGCGTQKNGCRATRNFGGYGSIDLPEEMPQAISTDSLKADLCYAWKDKEGIIRIEYRLNK